MRAIGIRSTVMIVSGLRVIWRRLRLASVQVSARVRITRPPAGASYLEEDVVERSHFLGELGRLDSSILESDEDAGYLSYRAICGDRQRCALAFSMGVALAEHLCSSLTGLFVMESQLDQPTRHELLQLAGCSTGDDSALVQDGDVVGQFIGLFEILRCEEYRRPAFG